MTSQLDPTKLKLADSHARKEILFRMAVTGDRLLVGGSDAIVHDIDLAAEPTKDVRQLSEHRGYVSGCVAHGNTLISGAYDGKLIWWNIETAEVIQVKAAHRRWVRNLAISNDGALVASVSDDMDCHVWDLQSGQKIRTLRGHADKTPQHFPSMLYAVAFSNDGLHLATADRIGKMIVWSLETGEKAAEFTAEKMYTWDPKQRIHSIGGIRSLAFSPDDRLRASGGIGHIGNIDHLGALARVEIFDWSKNERVHEFAGDKHKGLVEQIRFAPNGQWLMAIGGDNGGFIQFYDLEKGEILWQDKAPMHVHDVWMDDQQIVAVGHQRIAVWKPAT